MKLTTEDIAKICGVSRGTVDRALNGRGEINPETKRRILQTAQGMGYRPNLLASSLSTGRTRTFGVVVFNLKNEFFSYLLGSIEAHARAMGYFVYITLTNKDPQVEAECIDRLVARKVDGIVLCPINTDATYRFADVPVPVVSINNRIGECVPHVGIDDFEAQRQAVRHVVASGYEHIIFICPSLRHAGQTNIHASQFRYSGFLAGMAEAGANVAHTLIQDRAYESQLHSAIPQDKRTAIMCTSDIYAFRSINALRQRGIMVPRDVGIMGFDNIQTYQTIRPRLSTVAYPFEEVAAASVGTLIDMIEGRQVPSNTVIPHAIIDGETIQCAK